MRGWVRYSVAGRLILDRPRFPKGRSWTVRGRLGSDCARVSGRPLVSTAPHLHRAAPRCCMGRSAAARPHWSDEGRRHARRGWDCSESSPPVDGRCGKLTKGDGKRRKYSTKQGLDWTDWTTRRGGPSLLHSPLLSFSSRSRSSLLSPTKRFALWDSSFSASRDPRGPRLPQ